MAENVNQMELREKITQKVQTPAEDSGERCYESYQADGASN